MYIKAPQGSVVVGTISYRGEDWLVYVEPSPQNTVITARSLQNGRERSAGYHMDHRADTTNRKQLSGLFEAIYQAHGWYETIVGKSNAKAFNF